VHELITMARGEKAARAASRSCTRPSERTVEIIHWTKRQRKENAVAEMNPSCETLCEDCCAGCVCSSGGKLNVQRSFLRLCTP